jgi:hypothetical protein
MEAGGNQSSGGHIAAKLQRGAGPSVLQLWQHHLEPPEQAMAHHRVYAPEHKVPACVGVCLSVLSVLLVPSVPSVPSVLLYARPLGLLQTRHSRIVSAG